MNLASTASRLLLQTVQAGPDGLVGRFQDGLGQGRIGVDGPGQVLHRGAQLQGQGSFGDEVGGLGPMICTPSILPLPLSETIFTWPTISPMACGLPSPRNWKLSNDKNLLLP